MVMGEKKNISFWKEKPESLQTGSSLATDKEIGLCSSQIRGDELSLASSLLDTRPKSSRLIPERIAIEIHMIHSKTSMGNYINMILLDNSFTFPLFSHTVRMSRRLVGYGFKDRLKSITLGMFHRDLHKKGTQGSQEILRFVTTLLI